MTLFTQKIKYIIYKDLWEKGYYVANGAKFGGDYLVYPGNVMSSNLVMFCITMLCSCYRRFGSRSLTLRGDHQRMGRTYVSV